MARVAGACRRILLGMSTPTAVPPGINFERVSLFFARNVEGGNCPLAFTLISGGKSNLTYHVAGGGKEWVLRRPPLGHVLPTAHDMAREYRVLAALAGTNVPVPRPHALCEDRTVNDQPFYVMDYCAGVIVAEELPEGFATTLDERDRMSGALVDTLVALHAVDYNAVGLSDFGRPEGYVERQVRRWGEQWERSKTREVPVVDEAMRRLKGSVPVSPAPTIVHGDFRFGNMILNANDPGRVEAILDWEMATLGDPLSDLAYTLIYWGEETDDPVRLELRRMASVTARPGFWTRDQIVQAYGQRSGRNVEAIDFYQVLAYYKLAVICEGIHSRYLAGETVGEGFDTYAEQSQNLCSMAIQIADESADGKLHA